jgi:RNA polymerase sigma factor (sigma-70 family)
MVVASGDVRLPRFARRDAGVEVERLYRRHAGEVLRYASLVLRSRADAEDITQTVFLRALRALERGERVRTPRNWLIKITHNECRRLLANRKFDVELPDEIAVEPAEPGRAEELRVALTALPTTQRDALVLRELEGRSYAEIAQTLDLSDSAVETLIFRARRAVREQLEYAIRCEEFAVLLDDPSARAQVRAHARVCPECATLERQSRGRKSALRRIASAFGLPWWSAKLAAVGLTTATVAAVAVGVPHDSAQPTAPATHRNLIPPPTQSTYVQQSGGTRFQRPNLVPPGSHPKLDAHGGPRPLNLVPPGSRSKLVAPGGGTRFKSLGPAIPAERETPQPAPLPSPTKIVPAALPVTNPLPAVTVPETVLPPLPDAPTATVPTVTVPLPAPEPPAVTVPVEVPQVSLP